MKLLHIVAAGGLLIGLTAPVLAQMPPPNGDAGMHQNDPNSGPGPQGDMRGGSGMHDGAGMDRAPGMHGHGGPDMRDGHDMGRGPGMDGHDMRDHPRMGGDHRGWRGGYHQRCRTVWRHHHRVRRCMR